MNSSRFAALITLVLISTLSLSTAWAGAPRTHDGFFLRLSAGGGYAKTSVDAGGDNFEISGPIGDVNFAIGSMVSPNLAIHGTIIGWTATDPTVEWTGVASGEFNGDVTLSAVGPGITYYFMPSNLYLSASVGLATLTADISGGPAFDSDTGVAVDLTLGKEWWVGDSWGLGVAGGLMVHSIPDGGIDENWTGTSFAIRFSATYN